MKRRSFIIGMAGAVASFSAAKFLLGEDLPGEQMLFRARFRKQSDGRIIEEKFFHRVITHNDEDFSILDKENPIFEYEAKESMTFFSLQIKVPDRLAHKYSHEWVSVNFNGVIPATHGLWVGDILVCRVS